jgi:hypothetical protein
LTYISVIRIRGLLLYVELPFFYYCWCVSLIRIIKSKGEKRGKGFSILGKTMGACFLLITILSIIAIVNSGNVSIL